MALPASSEHTKSKLNVHPYSGTLHYANVLQWVYKGMSGAVHNLSSSNSSLSSWMSTSGVCASDVCLLLVSSLALPPFLASALSVRLSGRVRVGITNPETFDTVAQQLTVEDREEDIPADVAQDRGRTRTGRYYIWNNGQSRIEYAPLGGQRRVTELLNYRRMLAYLQSFAPDLSDVFICALALTNILAVLTIFDVRGSPLQVLSYFLWTLCKYNVVQMMCWMFVLSVAHRPLLARPFAVLWHMAWSRLITTGWARQLIGLVHTLLQQHVFTAFSFLGLNTVLLAIRRRWAPWTLDEPEPWSEWFRFPRYSVAFYGGRPTFSYRSTSPTFTPRIQSLIAELNLQNFQVMSSCEHDYLFSLNERSIAVSDMAVSAIVHAQQQQTHAAPSLGLSPTLRKQRFCVRCRIVKTLSLKATLSKLQRRPCTRCGFKGSVPGSGEQQKSQLLSGMSNTGNDPTNQCAICLDNYQIGQRVVELPCCHEFHRTCVLAWLLTDAQQTCPCCRWPANRPKETPDK